MPFNVDFGANGPTIKDIEDFLNGIDQEASPTSETEENPPAPQQDDGKTETSVVNETQAFAHRLKEATTKARTEERNNIAKEFGYESYEEMQRAHEKQMFEARGLDPEEVAPVVEELVQKRLQEDPRLKELDDFRQQKMQTWAKTELAELKTLTGGKIETLNDVPKEVIELWKQKGSLKAAYLELEGEKLIREMQSGIAGEHSRGTVRHLQSPQGAPTPMPTNEKRPYTDKEKAVYKLFNPNVTDDELNKLRKDY